MVSEEAARVWGALMRRNSVKRETDPELWEASRSDEVRAELERLAAVEDVRCHVIESDDALWLVPMKGSPRAVAPSKAIASDEGATERALTAFVFLVVTRHLTGRSEAGGVRVFTMEKAIEWVDRELSRDLGDGDGDKTDFAAIKRAWNEKKSVDVSPDETARTRTALGKRSKELFMNSALAEMERKDLLCRDGDGLWSGTRRLHDLWGPLLAEEELQAEMAALGLDG